MRFLNVIFSYAVVHQLPRLWYIRSSYTRSLNRKLPIVIATPCLFAVFLAFIVCRDEWGCLGFWGVWELAVRVLLQPIKRLPHQIFFGQASYLHFWQLVPRLIRRLILAKGLACWPFFYDLIDIGGCRYEFILIHHWCCATRIRKYLDFSDLANLVLINWR